MKKYTLAVSLILSIILLLFIIFIAFNRAVVLGASQSTIFPCGSEYEVDKCYDAIVVLGAGIRADGTPSHMLGDRLRAAVALYKAGVSQTVVLSGDNSGEDYDEVSAMVKYCLEEGIPVEDIVRDDIGFSTYETMYNAIASMGYRNIIVVTQEYHLYRALYSAEKMGANADGFSADYRSYSGQLIRDVREYFARAKDFLKVNLSFE